MYKKTVTYEDYDGNKRTEDFLFNFSKAEVLELELSEAGGLGKSIQNIIDTNDPTKLMKIFKELVVKAYGEKSADGRLFKKNDEIRDNFVQCPAYSIIFMELATNSKAAAEFFNKTIPQDMQQELNDSKQK